MPSASSPSPEPSQSVARPDRPAGWLRDSAWGLVIALVVLALLVFSASPFRSERGFIYIDF